jgi:hypothetical protein
MPENIEFWACIDCEIQDDGKTIAGQSIRGTSEPLLGRLASPQQGVEMSDESKNEEKPLPKVHIEPLSVAAFGPLNVLVHRKTVEQPSGAKSAQIYVSIKRTQMLPDDEPNAIPLIELPALVMLLKNVAEPAMTVRTLQQPTNPMVPRPGEEPVTRGKGKRGRR